MPDQLPPGPELDERVCRALGWEPDHYQVGGVNFSTSVHAALAAKDTGCVILKFWPAVSTDGNVMLRAIEAMRERGWNCRIDAAGTSDQSSAVFSTRGWGKALLRNYLSSDSPEKEVHIFGSVPHAVVLAILEALEPKK